MPEQAEEHLASKALVLKLVNGDSVTFFGAAGVSAWKALQSMMVGPKPKLMR